MRIPFTLLACCLLTVERSVSASLPVLSRRDAPFEEVRTHLKHDHRKKDFDKPQKYFHESTFHEHYDGRFADRRLSYEDRRAHLTALTQTYLSCMNDLGIETFIMHGSLLGWYWNRHIMPWDDDIDVMVSEKSMFHLAKYYNMTVYTYKLSGIEGSRDYLLEINPFYWNGTVDMINKIDGRWIDTDSGLYIDITTLRRNKTADALGEDGSLMVKDGHSYNFDSIFPLRTSTFENSPVKVPFAYADLLIEEYGSQALTALNFGNHKFDVDKKEWLALGLVRRPLSHREHSFSLTLSLWKAFREVVQ